MRYPVAVHLPANRRSARRPQLSITAKLALIFVLFATALMVSVGALAYNNGRAALQQATTADLISTVSEKKAALTSWVEERQRDLSTLAASPRVRAELAVMAAYPAQKAARVAHDQLVAELRTEVASRRAYLAFLVLDAADGRVIAATDPVEEGAFKSSLPYFLGGKRGSFIQNPYYSTALQELAMTASTPILAKDGQLLAVLAGQLNMAEMEAIITRDSDLHQSSDAFLMNSAGQFVTQPHMVADPVVLQRVINTEASQRCLAGASGTTLADDYRGIPAIVAYNWLDERQLCLITKIDQAEAFAPVSVFGRQLLLIGGLALLLASVVAGGLARTITRPLLALQAGAARFSRGELKARLPERPDNELGRLGRAFNTMAGVLAEQEAQLRSYAAQLEQKVEARTAELQAALARLHRLVDANIIGIAVAGAGGEIFEANDYYLGLLGYTRAELEAGLVRWIDMTPPEHLPADQRAIAELEATGVCTPYEKEYLRKDGSRVWVLIHDAVLPQEEGKIIALVQDVSDRKKAEANLAHYTEELGRSNAELARFAYIASHDLQEPLRMVASYTQLLARRYRGKLDADADEFIAYAADGATHMQLLINDLLAYSRVGTQGRLPAPVDCEAVLERTLMNLKFALEESGARVTHERLPVVLGDASQLGQVFQNLIGNALKFRGNAPSHVHIGAEQRGAEWLFTVGDNGIGIDPQYAERIFVIFQRLHTREEYPGSGIGLAICRKIVERHGGKIWLDPEARQGARFCFTLPCRGGDS